jgi:spermidine/putrescine transport system permease protein
MAFTLSIDDFVITFFTAGAGVPTLPLTIYTMIKIAVTPEVNALSTLLMLITLTMIAIASRIAPDAIKGKG